MEIFASTGTFSWWGGYDDAKGTFLLFLIDFIQWNKFKIKSSHIVKFLFLCLIFDKKYKQRGGYLPTFNYAFFSSMTVLLIFIIVTLMLISGQNGAWKWTKRVLGPTFYSGNKYILNIWNLATQWFLSLFHDVIM